MINRNNIAMNILAYNNTNKINFQTQILNKSISPYDLYTGLTNQIIDNMKIIPYWSRENFKALYSASRDYFKNIYVR